MKAFSSASFRQLTTHRAILRNPKYFFKLIKTLQFFKKLRMIKKIIDFAYWPIFGDLGSFEEVMGSTVCNSNESVTDLETDCV